MPQTRIQAALGGTADDVEAAFYEALQSGDIDKLMACWADVDDIVCVHPDGPRVVGGVAIRATGVNAMADKYIPALMLSAVPALRSPEWGGRGTLPELTRGPLRSSVRTFFALGSLEIDRRRSEVNEQNFPVFSSGHPNGATTDGAPIRRG